MPEQKLVLKKVTPTALRFYKKKGMLDFKAADVVIAEKTFDVFCDPKALAELLDVSFVKDFTKDDLETIDLVMVNVGVQGFLDQFAAALRK